MSLASLIREYNDIELEQTTRLVRMFELFEQQTGPGTVLVICGQADQPHAEQVKSFSRHQRDQFLERHNRTVSYWSTGQDEPEQAPVPKAPV